MGGRNVAVGDGALYSETTQIQNTAVGYHALYASITGNTIPPW